jgi:hypothetical protein
MTTTIDIDSHDAMEGLNAEHRRMAPYAVCSYCLNVDSINCAVDSFVPFKTRLWSRKKTWWIIHERQSMTDTLRVEGRTSSSPDGGNAISAHQLSSKRTSTIEGETQGKKECFSERHPEHGILTSPQRRKKVFSSPLVFVNEDVCNKSMPSLSDHSIQSRSEFSMPSLSEYSTPSLSEYSMPSLSSVRESEVSGGLPT